MHERTEQDEKMTGGSIVEKPTISISLERYEELVKKEEIFDRLAAENSIELYLVKKEVKQNGYA